MKSWTVYFLDQTGTYECAITVSGETLDEIRAEAEEVLRALKSNNMKPARSRPTPPKAHRTFTQDELAGREFLKRNERKKGF